MAEQRQNWIKSSIWGVLYLGALAAIFPQSALAQPQSLRAVQFQSPHPGSLAGRLTDLRSSPLAGVSVTLRNESTGAEFHTATAKNGAFRFASLDAGEYTLEADAAQLGHGRLEGILVTGGVESRIQAAVDLAPVAPSPVAAPLLVEAATPPPATVRPAASASASPALAASPAPPAVAFSPVHMPIALTAAAIRASVEAQPLLLVPLPALTIAQPPPPPPPTPAPNPPLTRPATVFPVSHPSLGVASPPLAESIAAEPVLPMPLAASRAVDTVRPGPQPSASLQSVSRLAAPLPLQLPAPAPPATRAPAIQPVTGASPTPSLASHQSPVFSFSQRAALGVQPIAFQLALSIAPPRLLPLRPIASPAPAAAAPPSAAKDATTGVPPAATVEYFAADPVESAVTTTVTAEQLQALPASGRRWEEFLADTPAASAAADASQTSFRGSPESAGITVDGANTRLLFGAAAGTGSRASDAAGDGTDGQEPAGRTWTGGRGLGVSEAAIREVTTASGNLAAEAMRSPGGQAEIHTESGAGQFHGQGFFFDRQNTWGARNPFTQWVKNTGTAASPIFAAVPFTPPDHETVWGLGMGGGIRRDKLTWFAALDSSRRNDPGVSTVRHPDEFFYSPESTTASVKLLSAQLDESPNQALDDYLGAPASGSTPAGLEQLASLLGPAPRTAAQWLGFARIDWQAAERHHLTLEGRGADWNSPGGGLNRVAESYGNHSFGSRESSRQWLLARWEAFLSPNLVAVTQGSVSRTIARARPEAPSTFEQSFLTGNVCGQLPQIVVDSRYGFTIGNPSRFGQGSYPDERLYQAQEMLAWVHGRLLVRSGFELDHDADAVSHLRNQTGTYHYSKVEDFISDALVFEKFGLNPDGWNASTRQFNQHNCDPANNGQLSGALPCYAYYSQMIGPADWRFSTNDWAAYTTAQWQPNKLAVFSLGLRWECQQMPSPIATLDNPKLPFTQKLPTLGNNWGPRAALAIGKARSRWPILRLGYGMYYGRVPNATIETALTQTGSLKGDLYYFIRRTDGYTTIDGTSSAPFFPSVLQGLPASVVKPGAVGFAPNFRNPEVHQAVAAIEQPLPGRVELTVEGMVSLGRRLPIAIDTNINTNITGNADNGMITYAVKDSTGKGPINTSQTTQIKVPFYASWPPSTGTCPYYTRQSSDVLLGRLCPDYQQITQITSRANSTYEAAVVRLVRYGTRGLSFHAHYTYAHAMDWNPGETASAAGSDALDPNPARFHDEYGTGNLDVRHSAAIMTVFEAPWKLHGIASRFLNGWMLSGIGHYRSGLPYTMRTTGSIPMEFGTNVTISGLGPGMNGSGGDNRVYGVGRNTFRHPNVWKADLHLAKRFDLGEGRQLELIAESFNLFNHQNVTGIETNGYSIENNRASGGNPTLCYLTINSAGSASCGSSKQANSGTLIPAFGQPLNVNATDFFRERQIQLGLRLRF